MISKKNIMICSLLIAGAHAYAMDQDKVDQDFTQSQAETIKKEVGKRFNRRDEKFYVIPQDVMQLIENNSEINQAFNVQKTPVQPPETFKSRLAWFNAVVDSYVKKNQ